MQRLAARQRHTLIVSLWVVVLGGVARPQTATITVPVNGDLQAALDTARPGDVILLEAGASYTGNFRLPAKTRQPLHHRPFKC